MGYCPISGGDNEFGAQWGRSFRVSKEIKQKDKKKIGIGIIQRNSTAENLPNDTRNAEYNQLSSPIFSQWNTHIIHVNIPELSDFP